MTRQINLYNGKKYLIDEKIFLDFDIVNDSYYDCYLLYFKGKPVGYIKDIDLVGTNCHFEEPYELKKSIDNARRWNHIMTAYADEEEPKKPVRKKVKDCTIQEIMEYVGGPHPYGFQYMVDYSSDSGAHFIYQIRYKNGIDTPWIPKGLDEEIEVGNEEEDKVRPQ